MANTAARALWEARTNGTKIPTDFDGCPVGEDEAYKIQSDMISVAGLDVIGWKIGATVEALFAVLGVEQPFLGPLFAKYTHADGAEVSILPGHSLETEITIKLKSDLPARPTPYTRAELENVVAAIHPSFEIVGARFEGALAGAGYRVIADGGVNVGTVVGPAISNWGDYDLGNYPITLSVNGKSVAEGNSSVLLWDHVFDALAWCVSQPALATRGLCAGDIVMTGTCTGITPISPGDHAVADFGKMGEVRASFV